MLELIANNQSLELGNVSFNITLRSSVIDNSGSYIYNFSIPYTPFNARTFGFPFRLSRFKIQTASVTGHLSWNNRMLLSGTWKAISTNGKTIKLEMLIGAGEFNSLVDKKTLPEFFDIETTVADIVLHVNEQVTKTWPEVNHNFPTIFNPKFYGDTASDDNPNKQWGGFMNDFAGTFLVTAKNNNTISPQLYLLYILKRLFEANGYTAKGSVFSDSMFQKAMIYNNYALDKLHSNAFYGELNDDAVQPQAFIIEWDENLDDPGEHYDGAGKYRVTTEGNYKINLSLLHKPVSTPVSPYYYRIEIFYGSNLLYEFQSANNPGVNLIQDNNEHSEYINTANVGDDLYIKLRWIDGNGQWVIGYVDTGSVTIVNQDAPEYNIYLNNFNYKNHVPDKDVKEFLLSVYNSAKILPFFNHEKKEVELIFLKNVLSATAKQEIANGLYRDSLNINTNDYSGFKFGFTFDGPDDLIKDNFSPVDSATVKAELDKWLDVPGMAVSGTIYFIKSINAWYRRYYDEDTETWYWKAFMDNILPYTLGNGSEELTSILAPMLMRCEANADNLRRNTPAISSPGTSSAFGIANEFPLRIMFWIGLSGTSNGIYPFATTVKYDTGFNEVLPMSWVPEEIAAVYLDEFIKWLQRRHYIEFTLDMLPVFIKSFDFSIKTNFENSEALFEEIYVKISNRNFGPASLKGWAG